MILKRILLCFSSFLLLECVHLNFIKKAWLIHLNVWAVFAVLWHCSWMAAIVINTWVCEIVDHTIILPVQLNMLFFFYLKNILFILHTNPSSRFLPSFHSLHLPPPHPSSTPQSKHASSSKTLTLSICKWTHYMPLQQKFVMCKHKYYIK